MVQVGKSRETLADLGGRARRAPPHLPGILVFDDILGHIV